VNIFNDERFNSLMWVKICFSIWVHNAMYVLHFGFLFNDECL